MSLKDALAVQARTALSIGAGEFPPWCPHTSALGTEASSCGALLEHRGLYERVSAAENLDYYGRIWLMSKAGREKRIRELLEPLDLYARCAEPIGRWSRGMKQKLAVARTLMHRRELIFLGSSAEPSKAVLRVECLVLSWRRGKS